MIPIELEAQLERLHPDSFGWALHCCSRDETEAEDVLQTAYLRVLSGSARYRGRSTFKTWLFGVIRLVAHEHHRRSRARQERTLAFVPEEIRDTTNPDPQEEVEVHERKQALLASLRTLSGRQREALHLVFYQDLTIEEAAEVMGVSLGSARTHYQRGKERLRALLLQDGSR